VYAIIDTLVNDGYSFGLTLQNPNCVESRI
jgi:hypothetical protein